MSCFAKRRGPKFKAGDFVINKNETWAAVILSVSEREGCRLLLTWDTMGFILATFPNKIVCVDLQTVHNELKHVV